MESMTPTMAGLIAGFVAGLVAGLVPYFVADFRGRRTAAVATLAITAVGGMIGGLIVAAPLSIALTVFALSGRSGERDASKRLSPWKVGVPATLALWISGMGVLALLLPLDRIPMAAIVSISFAAPVVGGWLTSLVLHFANRSANQRATADLAAKIAAVDTRPAQPPEEKP